MKAQDTGLKRILKAFTYSFDGLRAVWKSEAAFRQEIFLCALLSLVALFLPFGILQKYFLLFSLFLILFAELVNSAIEAVVDRISDDFHILSKKAKDIGSLIVLMAFVHAVIAWIICFYLYYANV